ncbi:T9SS type A sorting domain-containing protein [candidate division KSB1 bacterium]
MSNTIRVLTTDVINNDTVYHLNTIITPCDTCHSDLGGISNPNGDAFALRNQPQFLQRKMMKLSNDVYYFYDTLKICIPAYAKLNDTWLFDSVMNLTATVLQIGQGMVLGNMDSVKTILLSNNDTLILSKNFGITLFPDFFLSGSYYLLVGVEGPDVGIVLPNFWEIYSYDSGDVFQYSRRWGGSSIWSINNDIIKLTIHSRTEKNDTLIFKGNEILTTMRYPPTNPYDITYDTLIYQRTFKYINSKNHPANLSTGEYVDSHLIIKNIIRKDSNNLYVKDFGCSNWNNCTKLFGEVQGYPDILRKMKNLSMFHGCFLEQLVLTQHLGLTTYFMSCFEHEDDFKLTGYVIDGDTVGTITPDDVMLSIRDKTNDTAEAFLVYPNPAKDYAKIVFNPPLKKSAMLELYDISGRIMQKKEISKGTGFYILDILDIPEGMYFISVTGNKVRRIVIMNYEL